MVFSFAFRYTALMADADARHQYARWRRNRAVRCSAARQQIQHLLADDKAKWEEGSATSSTAIGVVTPTLTRSSLEKRMAVANVEGTVSTKCASAAAEPDAPGFLADSAALGDADIDMQGEGTPSSTDRSTDSAMKTASANRGDDGWRCSVRVNSEAGNRSSISFSSPDLASNTRSDGSTTLASPQIGTPGSQSKEKKAVRVLREPGDSGKSAYECLYGSTGGLSADSSTLENEEISQDISAESLSLDVDVPIQGKEQRLDTDMTEVDADEDHDSENLGAGSALPRQCGDAVDSPSSASDVEAAEASVDEEVPSQTQLDTLPDIHDFFSHQTSSEDLTILLGSLTQVSTAAYPLTRCGYHLLTMCFVRKDSEDVEELSPFPLIVHGCVEVPVQLIGNMFDRLALELFLDDLHVMEHLRWLRKIMLMSEGLCMDIFARDLLAGTRSATRVSWGLFDRWASALSLAMIESRIYSDDIAQRFYYNTSEELLRGEFCGLVRELSVAVAGPCYSHILMRDISDASSFRQYDYDT